MTDKSTQRAALTISCMSSFMTPYLSSAVSIALPAIGHEFGMGAVSLGWVNTAFLLAAAGFLLPFGKLGDMTGRKRIYLLGIAGFTLFSAAAALVPNGTMLIVAASLLGVTGAMIFGTGIAILTSAFPPEQRGKVLGISVAFTYGGLSAGPLLGGLLTHAIGWRGVYLLNVPIGVVAVGLILARLKGEWIGERSRNFDTLGALLSMVALVTLIYGLTIVPAASGVVLIVVGLLFIGLFIHHERRATNPVLSVSLFRESRVFGMSNLAALINYSATFALTFFLSLYFQYIKGLSPGTAGVILISQPLLMTLFSPIAGKLSDRYEPRLLASLGMATMFVMLGVLAFMGPRTSIGLMIAVLALVGVGYAFFSSPNTNAVMGSVERRNYGVASATLGTMRLLGQMFSMALAIMILNILVGRVGIRPEVYPQLLESQHLAFAIFSAFCFAGIFASLARGNRTPAQEGAGG